MDIEVVDVAPCVKKISVAVPVEEIEIEKADRLRQLAKNAKVPGFRQGRAPHAVLKKMYGKQVHGDVAQKVVDQAFRKAIADHHLNPVGDPMVDTLIIEEGAPISFVATIETFPAVDLKPLDGLSLTRKIRPVDQDEIDTVLTQYRERQARFEPVEGRGIEEGDYIMIDYSATRPDGTPLEHFKGEGRQAHVDVDQMFQGFHDGIIGMTTGETRSFDAPMPEDYPDPETAGKPVTFTIVLHEIKKKVLPELDDDLAKEVSEFDTIDELVADIRKGAEEQNRSMADSRLREDLMTKLIADNPFDLPPGLLEKQTRHMAQRRRQQLASQGIDPSAIGMDEAALDGRAADDAVRSLKEQAILAAFGDAAGVRIGDADLDREIARLAAMFGQSPEMTRQQLGQGGGLDALANQAYADKVYAAMMEKIAVAETVEKAAAEPSEG